MSRIALILLVVWAASSPPAAAGVLVIDPGHGGSANSGSNEGRTLSSCNNAISPGGLKEKDLTLELSLEIQHQIEQLTASDKELELACILTRDSDENPDFASRSEVCANLPEPPLAIVSIHFNASKEARSTGTVAMVEHPSRNPNYETDVQVARELTKVVSDEVSAFFNGSRPREPITDEHLHGGQGSNFFYQLRLRPETSGVPKCFLEVEFIDRPDAEEQLLHRRREAFPKIARAIALWFKDYSRQRGTELLLN